jgi:hypothetical protein
MAVGFQNAAPAADQRPWAIPAVPAYHWRTPKPGLAIGPGAAAPATTGTVRAPHPTVKLTMPAPPWQ